MLLFYLISGPPTFLDVVTLSPGDTVFHTETWSRDWCECVLFQSFHNASLSEIALYRFPSDVNLSLSRRVVYNVTQNVSNTAQEFEYWEANFHPGGRGTACFAFSQPINYYFAPRYYVDGAERDPDYAAHAVQTVLNVSSGCMQTPPFVESGGWAFVWERQFKTQDQTVGTVQYAFDMVEYAVPAVNATNVRVGEGQFCWELGAPEDVWLLVAKEGFPVDPGAQRLEAHTWCVPRYKLTIPITAIPVAIAVVLEILIILLCICKPLRKQRQAYAQI